MANWMRVAVGRGVAVGADAVGGTVEVGTAVGGMGVGVKITGVGGNEVLVGNTTIP